MRNFVQPPKLETNVPMFLFERNMTNFIRKFIEWSQVEYLATIDFYRRKKNSTAASVIESNYAPHHVAASRNDFQKIVKLMTSNVWNSLSREERAFLNQTYQVSTARMAE